MITEADRELYRRWFKEFWKRGDDRTRAYSGNTDQPNGHAASLEALCCFRDLVPPTGRVFDAGAGASTCMLRSWFGDRVVSSDPDLKYLQLVNTICLDMDLPGGTWPSPIPGENLAAVFYDYGTHERCAYLPAFLEQLAPGGVMYVDDADDRLCCHPLHTCVRSIARLAGFKLVERREAMDDHGRWGVTIHKDPR